MTPIFEHRDRNGDRLTIREAGVRANHVFAKSSTGGAFLSPDAVTRLRAALAAYDPTEQDAKTNPAPAIEVGGEYRLLPDAKYRAGQTEYCESQAIGDGVTRVRVEYGPDQDGDYEVIALDGECPGYAFAVMPRYLAPIEDTTPAPAVEVGGVYRVLTGARASVSGDRSSIALDEVTRVRVHYGPDSDGDYRVTALDGKDPGERYFVLPQYLAPLDELDEAPAIEVDRVYRLLPGTRYCGGCVESGAVADGVTRVRVEDGPDRDGDYAVTALDGRHPGREYFAPAQYLAPIDDVEQVEGVSETCSIIDETHVWHGTTAAPTLDARRVAALTKAVELAGANVFGVRDANAILGFAAFLLDEQDDVLDAA